MKPALPPFQPTGNDSSLTAINPDPPSTEITVAPLPEPSAPTTDTLVAICAS